jgi:Protein of unknown function (DUF3300)
MMCLKIWIARGAVAICLTCTAISGVALALGGTADRPSMPAGAMAASDATEPSGLAITSQDAPGVPPAPAVVSRTPNSSPGISVTPVPNTAPVPPPSPGALPSPPIATQTQLARLVAPIALYPDPLLAQILMASTYPLEVVEAARWVNANRALKGDALTANLQAQDWDPSVKALVPFPRVLQIMSDQLQWTQELGNAFLAQQAELMATVQSLRQEAMLAGNLKQSPECRCVIRSSGGAISILPADPQVVCAPVYTPAVYGAWPYPAYPPYYFPVPVGFVFAPGLWIGFAPPIELAVFGPFWGWGWIDWGHRWIAVDSARLALVSGGHVWFSGNVWVHDPAHRGGVAYADPATRARFNAGRVGALNAAARVGTGRDKGADFSGATRFQAAGHEVFRGTRHVGSAASAHGGAAAFHGSAAFHGGGGGGHVAMDGPQRGGPDKGPHGGRGAHFAAAGPHGGGGTHGGGVSHFAMGAGPHGGGPGGGGRPHGGSGGAHGGGGHPG